MQVDDYKMGDLEEAGTDTVRMTEHRYFYVLEFSIYFENITHCFHL